MITQDIRYAVILVQEVRGKQGTIREISQKYGLSEKFLEFVAAKLRRTGLLVGSRGRHGGYSLVRRTVSMLDLMCALGREPKAIRCFLTDECKGGAVCLEREIEAKMIGEMNDSFAQMTVTR